MRLPGLTLIALLFATASHAAQVQAQLIRATNDEKLAYARLEALQPKLKKKFGYPYYQQMGEKQEALKADTTNRLDLGEGFVVFVTPKSTDKKVHELDIEWTSGRASLVKSTVKIREGGHLFIKGPGVLTGSRAIREGLVIYLTDKLAADLKQAMLQRTSFVPPPYGCSSRPSSITKSREETREPHRRM
jgi:hypothetical protein